MHRAMAWPIAKKVESAHVSAAKRRPVTAGRTATCKTLSVTRNGQCYAVRLRDG